MNNITENKLIAEFMGYKYFPHPARDPGWRKEKGHLKIHGYFLCRTHNQLRYHRDWSWLMPVVEKIAKTGYAIDIKIGQVDSSVIMRRIGIGDENDKLHCLYYSTPLLAAYSAVVQFIQWYNTQTTQP